MRNLYQCENTECNAIHLTSINVYECEICGKEICTECRALGDICKECNIKINNP